jgi:pyridoxal 5'-phosphate synthase pdxT subunit
MADAPPGAPRAAIGKPLVGVLALQGGFEAHERVLERLGATVREVRVGQDLEALDGLVIPGGESTTMSLGLAREGLVEPLRQRILGGVPVLGSCAGLIMLDRDHLDVMDISARRNAFGRQLHSFEADIDVRGLPGGPLRAIFIRAPWIEAHGPGVEVLAEVDGHPVAAREGSLVAVAFHGELGDDDRVHEMFMELVRRASDGSRRRRRSPEAATLHPRRAE